LCAISVVVGASARTIGTGSAALTEPAARQTALFS
jgi:hypothetical protein